MSVLDWAFDVEGRAKAVAQRREEARRAAVARAQAKVLRRQRRRDTRMRLTRWLGFHKMVFYPVGAVTAFTVGAFTASTLAGFIVLGLGFLAIEWRVGGGSR